MYLWIKTIHVLAVVLWMGGMLAGGALGVFLHQVKADEMSASALFRWYRRLVTPAMIVALGSGIWAAQIAGWFSAPWLHAKLALVFAMTAIHGVMSGQLRRLSAGIPENDGRRIARRLRSLGWWTGIILSLIVVLAVRKTIL